MKSNLVQISRTQVRMYQIHIRPHQEVWYLEIVQLRIYKKIRAVNRNNLHIKNINEVLVRIQHIKSHPDLLLMVRAKDQRKQKMKFDISKAQKRGFCSKTIVRVGMKTQQIAMLQVKRIQIANSCNLSLKL